MPEPKTTRYAAGMQTSPYTDGNDDNAGNLHAQTRDTPGVESGSYDLPEEIGVPVGGTHADHQAGV